MHLWTAEAEEVYCKLAKDVIYMRNVKYKLVSFLLDQCTRFSSLACSPVHEHWTASLIKDYQSILMSDKKDAMQKAYETVTCVAAEIFLLSTTK